MKVRKRGESRERPLFQSSPSLSRESFEERSKGGGNGLRVNHQKVREGQPKASHLRRVAHEKNKEDGDRQ